MLTRFTRSAALLAAGAAVGVTALGVSSASPRRAATATVPTPPARVTAQRITQQRLTVKPGTRVRSSQLGSTRVFVDDSHGFALASVGSAQYPAATADGGRTWRTNGPVLHEDAAQAPLAVDEVGAIDRRTEYFFGGGGSVVDSTGDGGRHWWRAFLGDAAMAVVPGVRDQLVAFVQTALGDGTEHALTSVYVSRDGGHHWRHDANLGAF